MHGSRAARTEKNGGACIPEGHRETVSGDAGCFANFVLQDVFCLGRQMQDRPVEFIVVKGQIRIVRRVDFGPFAHGLCCAGAKICVGFRGCDIKTCVPKGAQKTAVAAVDIKKRFSSSAPS